MIAHLKGRLDEAAGEGRMGVAKSIVGRMEWLGGSATLTTELSMNAMLEPRIVAASTSFLRRQGGPRPRG